MPFWTIDSIDANYKGGTKGHPFEGNIVVLHVEWVDRDGVFLWRLPNIDAYECSIVATVAFVPDHATTMKAVREDISERMTYGVPYLAGSLMGTNYSGKAGQKRQMPPTATHVSHIYTMRRTSGLEIYATKSSHDPKKAAQMAAQIGVQLLNHMVDHLKPYVEGEQDWFDGTIKWDTLPNVKAPNKKPFSLNDMSDILKQVYLPQVQKQLNNNMILMEKLNALG